ncbi:UbiA prenyltransferase [Amniculicola lignicola CBS 123094]|uniref:UbiA prenyltransferase n=1 Tax=Amniculicola lignicola CBS 123094 TaxID=1392246 RepID=A0A6A5X2X4_9PLEO|nr:UbiA prenyltransferase [Amniculicola lignicola CBS 123094]
METKNEQQANEIPSKTPNFLYTLFLFIRSDIKTIIIPQLLFALSSCVTSGFTTSASLPTSWHHIPFLFLKVLAWLCTLMLVENITNQRLPGSILEDSLNKPWRPLPSGRITPEAAQHNLLLLVPAAVILGIVVGAYKETTGLIVFIWMYDDLDGANQGIWLRNALQACGIMGFSAGVTAITAGSPAYGITNGATLWMCLNGLVVFTTVHAQDLPDIVGDAARGRRTIPLLYGDGVARFSLAVGVLVWSIASPAFWKLSPVMFLPTVALGATMALMTLLRRTEKSDKVVWKLWCLWIGTMYLLPLAG